MYISDSLCSENCHICKNQNFLGLFSFDTAINTDSIVADSCRLHFYDQLSEISASTSVFELFPSGIVAHDVPTSIVTNNREFSKIMIKFVDKNSHALSSYSGSNVSMTIESCGDAVFASCGNSIQILSNSCVQFSAPFWSEENFGISHSVQAVADFSNFSIVADGKVDGSCILKFVLRSRISPTHFVSTNSSFLLHASALFSSNIELAVTGVPFSFFLEWRDGTQKLNSLTSSRALISLSYCGNASLDCGSSNFYSRNSCLTSSVSGNSNISGFIIRGDATLNCRLTFTVLEYTEQVFTYQDFEVRASHLTVDSFPAIVRVGYPLSFISSARDDDSVQLLSLYGVTVKLNLTSCGLGTFDSCGKCALQYSTTCLLPHL
jgi:hypothetical protein